MTLILLSNNATLQCITVNNKNINVFQVDVHDRHIENRPKFRFDEFQTTIKELMITLLYIFINNYL